MNKQLTLIVGGILLVGTFLVGAIWGWVTVLEYLIGVLFITLIVFGRYAFLKNYSLGTMLYTTPVSWYYRVLNPHRPNPPRDLDDLSPFQKTQVSKEERESNIEERKH